MEKISDFLKTKIKDETAAFAILGTMIITFTLCIGTFEYINHQKTIEANASLLNIDEAALVSSNNEKNTKKVKTEIKDEDKLKKKNEEEYEKLKKENKLSSEVDRYYIKVNYGAQVVTVYTQDSNGDYTVPVRAMVCSTGTYTPTSGVYRTLGKGKWWGLIGPSYGQYSTWICGDILFHSVPYLVEGDKSSLEYWAYDQLGQRVSMGCVRLTVADALWIYNNCPVGTQVEFYYSSNPGPLGKPTTRKISDAPSNIRGWDPTDPDPDNPWPEYLKKLEEEENKKDEDKKPSKPSKPDKGENTVINDVTNDIVNDITNDITNDIVNDTTGEDIVNDIVNEPVNEVTDVNIVQNETIEDGQINEVNN